MNANEEKKTGKLQWILFVIVIPIIFAIVMLLIVLSVMGMNPINQLKEAPIVASFVDSKDEEILQSQLDEIQKESNNKNTQIENLQSQVSQKEAKIEELENEIADLNVELERREETLLTEEEAIKKMSNSFSGIEPKIAAEIIIEMEEQVALKLLEQMSDDERGKVLGAMNPEQAASYTDSLIERKSAE
ncbi:MULTISPECIES: magnesium transporter MgtE N-terminal domain-containing protein [Allobacillus]|nr:hypothetical protein [Allobacillus salarius]